EGQDARQRNVEAEFERHGIKFAGIYYAPYSVESNHPTRKPNPGMLLDANRDLGVDFAKSWMVGDRMTDVEAGHRAGCKSVLLEGTDLPDESDWAPPEVLASDLLTACRAIAEADRA
ncbi:MAG: HAD-IIIA family hydrolase, partial [Bdellovibrionota bacterium]